MKVQDTGLGNSLGVKAKILIVLISRWGAPRWLFLFLCVCFKFAIFGGAELLLWLPG
jgi:hypothetical protein